MFYHQQETSVLLSLPKELLLFRLLFRHDKLVDREAGFLPQLQREGLMLLRELEEETLGLNKLDCQREQVDNDEFLFSNLYKTS